MKLSKITILVFVFLASSCAMIFNDKEVNVAINSEPAGANIMIEGKNYGKTPATIRLVPKKYSVLLLKDGYGSTTIDLDYWAASLRNGKCFADAMGTMLVIPYYSLVFSGKCSDFKQKEYFATIPQSGSAANNSLIGIDRNPSDMINPYYQGQQGYGSGGLQQSPYSQQNYNSYTDQNPYSNSR